jgi:hypothetical protein
MDLWHEIDPRRLTLRNSREGATLLENLCVVAENGICYSKASMILFQKAERAGGVVVAALALTLAACAPVDDTIGSHLAQPPAGSPPRAFVDAGDIAIVGQDVSNAIVALPAVANATLPPLVQFPGVTSIVTPPIDTDPYTELLRDRLLLLTREKLRFVEHTLPPYVPPTSKKKVKKSETSAGENSQEADYQVLAELRGQADDDFYKIQVEFVDIHTNEILFDGLYRIRKEEAPEPEPQPSEGPASPTTSPAPSGGQVL